MYSTDPLPLAEGGRMSFIKEVGQNNSNILPSMFAEFLHQNKELLRAVGDSKRSLSHRG